MLTNYDVIIIGAGPAGIFSAYTLVKNNDKLKILILDRGRKIEQRKCPARITGKCVHCKPCAIVSGWSGAGAFSDGKLSLSGEVGGHLYDYLGKEKTQEYIKKADKIYLEAGANPIVYGEDSPAIDEIVYEASKYNIDVIKCPVRHLGTENALSVFGYLEEYVLSKGVDFLEMTDVKDITADDTMKTVITDNGEFQAKYLIIAPGRSGADWLCSMANKLGIESGNNEVDVGVRVEVPNSIMDRVTNAMYESKMIYYSDTYESKVRTFCMNPGGIVSEEHYDDGFCTVNGHSYEDKSLRTENTNFAVLVSSRFTEPFKDSIEYGKYIAKLGNMLTGGPIMVQRLGDLLKGRRTTATRLAKSTTRPTLVTAVPGDLSFVLPQRHLTSIIEGLKAFDKVCPGIFNKDTLLYGVETKFYSNKINVDNNLMTSIEGLYTIGDGAGITRGLMQASASGIYVAEEILKKL